MRASRGSTHRSGSETPGRALTSVTIGFHDCIGGEVQLGAGLCGPSFRACSILWTDQPPASCTVLLSPQCGHSAVANSRVPGACCLVWAAFALLVESERARRPRVRPARSRSGVCLPCGRRQAPPSDAAALGFRLTVSALARRCGSRLAERSPLVRRCDAAAGADRGGPVVVVIASLARRLSAVDPWRMRVSAAGERVRRCPVLEQIVDCLGLERTAEQESLTGVAVLLLQLAQLGLVLDPLAECLEAEDLAELYERVYERLGLARCGDAGDEGAIDLQRIYRELAQVSQRAVAGAEVVDRDPHAQCFEHSQPLRSGVGVAHQRRLGDLERERAWVETCELERFGDVVHEAVVVELAAGQIYRHPQRTAVAVPRHCLLTRRAQHPTSDRHDQPGRLCERNERVGLDDPSGWVAPADQRFDTGQLLGLQVERGLVEEEELVSIERFL